jgi:hypothetical protein
MDDRTFDRMARIVGSQTSRRASILAAIGMALGLKVPFVNPSSPAAAERDASDRSDRSGDETTPGQRDGQRNGKASGKSRGSGKRAGTAGDRPRGSSRGEGRTAGGPTPQGPCTPYDVKENRCRKDSDCCTNWCEKKGKPGQNAKDGLGRCRCRNWRDVCTRDTDCCKRGGQQMQCIGGICTKRKKGVPTGLTCTDSDICKDVDAVCGTYESGDPAGRYCLKPGGTACRANKDCASQKCANGTCKGGGKTIPTGQACGPADTCKERDAACVVYGTGKPRGTYCLKQDGESCKGHEQCQSRKCQDKICRGGGKTVPTGETCALGDTCKSGAAACTTYDSGSRKGTYCILPGTKKCQSDQECISGRCTKGTCTTSTIPTSYTCRTAKDTCKSRDAVCTAYDGGDAKRTHCLLPTGKTCIASADCMSNSCVKGVCAEGTTRIPTGQSCTAGKDLCAASAATCTSFTDPGAPAGTFCLLPRDERCTGNGDCISNYCPAGTCSSIPVPTSEACSPAADTCEASNATCREYTAAAQAAGAPAGTYCLLPRDATCGDDDECAGDYCDPGTTTCTSIPVATGMACDSAADTCADASATCLSYVVAGAPAGTYCLLPAGESCANDGECLSDACVSGVCAVPTSESCDPNVDYCADSAATCTQYTDPTAPSGTYCLLPAGETCSGDADCENDACLGGRCAIPTSEACNANRDTCLDPDAECTAYRSVNGPSGTYCLLQAGEFCGADADCEIEVCVAGLCAVPTSDPCTLGTDACADSAASCTTYTDPNAPSGTFCLLPDATSCTADEECVGDACVSGVCAVPTTEPCIAGTDVCADPDASCTVYTAAGATADTFCLLPTGESCTADDECVDDACVDNICAVATSHACIEGSDICADRKATCTEYTVAGAPSGTYCLLPGGKICAAGADCETDACVNGRCAIATSEACNTTDDTCASSTATCTTYKAAGTPSGTYCLEAGGSTCTADADCTSDGCTGGLCEIALT